MKTKRFAVKRNNLVIKGEIYIPQSCIAKYQTVIISHEFGLNMLSTQRYAKRFAELGYTAYIYDFCGSGAGISRGRKSTQMSVLTEVQDLGFVLDYVKSLPETDCEHIILVGCSQGGMVSALVAAERKDEIDKLILYYPAFCISDDARKGSMLGSKINPYSPPERFTALGYVRLGKEYVTDALKLDPWKEICSFDKPVLICHGDKDHIVPFSYAERAKKKYPNCTVEKISGAGHLFLNQDHMKEALKRTEAFLKDK